MADGQVVFEIVGDGTQAKAAIGDVVKAMQDAGVQIDRSSNDMEKAMNRAFDVNRIKDFAIQAGKALLQFGKEAVQAASDLKEAQNVVDATFGASSGKIDTWAKNAIKQFGLTEAQAKRFTSTLGAMAKSAGVTGPEIVEMSTDLAGLAADMASFYNLDFETAFQKIRSGIAGETEPLKQLGINMSVANLQAYALSKGISTAFDKMSQGEQTMLRYQYMMEATADAQGDFARTSDGYANSIRQLESNLDSLKAKLGGPIMDVLAGVTGSLNGMIDALFPTETRERTVLDDFAEIDANTDRRIAQIQATADHALALVQTLNDISGETTKSEGLVGLVDSLSTHFGGMESAMTAAKNSDYKGTIKGIADALSTNIGGDASQWSALLGAIADNLPKASDAINDDSGSLKTWLEDAASAADDLGGSYPSYWRQMMNALGSDKALSAIASIQAAPDAGGNIASIASGLASQTDLSADEWSTILPVLAANLPTIADNASDTNTSTWLANAAEAAGKLGGEYPALWESLVNTLGSEAAAAMVSNFAAASEGQNKLDALAAAANELKPGSALSWSGFLDALSNTSGLTGLFGTNADAAAKNIREMADALSGNSVTKSRAQAWSELLGALSQNAAGLSTLTGKDADETGEWLTKMADNASKINPEDAAAWQTFMGAFLEGLPHLGDTEEGQAVMDALLNGASGVGSAAESAIDYLSMFGIESDDIADAQQRWLDVCRRLVKEIPGLSSIINTQTGEVNGGTQAIKDYVATWQAGQEDLARLANLEERINALRESTNLTSKQNDVAIARHMYQNALTNAGLSSDIAPEDIAPLLESWTSPQFAGRTTYTRKSRGWNAQLPNGNTLSYDEMARLEGITNITDLANDLIKAESSLKTQEEANAKATSEMAAAEQEANEIRERLTGSTNDEAESLEEVTAAIDTATTSLQSMNDYMAKVREETKTNIDGIIKSFDDMATPADKARKELEGLSEVDKDGNVNKRWQSVKDTIATIGNMTANLESQAKFADRYMEALEKAERMGFNADMLAELADGSAESLDYLEALTKDGTSQAEVDKLNAAWENSQAAKQQLADRLTQTKLDADEEFQSLAQAATDAIAQLDQYSEADAAMSNTVQGIADGIASKIPEVQTQVDALNAVLSSLAGMGGLGVNWNPRMGVGNYNSLGQGGWMRWVPQHATGLDYVPFDNYLASLHEGESILTAEEARVWRNFKSGGAATRNNIDYSALSGAIWDSAPQMGGGNVYLNGQKVGRVISGAQADSYRAMERSGWQA